jgi:RNA polymerase sigma-70 factor (ECF subfamily)
MRLEVSLRLHGGGAGSGAGAHPSTVDGEAPRRSAADVAMDRYAGGDDGAFAEVYDEVAPVLYRYLYARVRTAAAAEDFLQQTFLLVHRARGTFIVGSSVLPWAFAIARRLLIDEHRRRGRTVAVAFGDWMDASAPATLDTPEEALSARELVAELSQALSALPETQRTAFELLRLHGLSHAEAAERTGTTVSAVKLRAHRAYAALRARCDLET